MAPQRESAGLPWLVLMVFPIKDVQARHKAVPIPVRKRSARDDDPLCAYGAIKRRWDEHPHLHGHYASHA